MASVPTVAEALARYSAEVGTKYAAIVRRYLEWGGVCSDASLSRYVRYLRDQGLGDGTIDLYIRTVRAFYRRNGLHPPAVKGWRYSPSQAVRPALDRDVVERLVSAARDGVLSPRQETLLALATTYGMRAEEMARVKSEDVDRDGGRIFVHTAKGGRPRWCWLPPEIAERLQHDWPGCSASDVVATFGRMWRAADLGDRPRRVAWHSVRRSLVRDLLVAGVPGEDVGRFMRWASSDADELRMVALYGHPTHTVGAGGMQRVQEGDPGSREYDAVVWDRHPYLPLWRF